VIVAAAPREGNAGFSGCSASPRALEEISFQVLSTFSELFQRPIRALARAQESARYACIYLLYFARMADTQVRHTIRNERSGGDRVLRQLKNLCEFESAICKERERLLRDCEISEMIAR